MRVNLMLQLALIGCSERGRLNCLRAWECQERKARVLIAKLALQQHLCTAQDTRTPLSAFSILARDRDRAHYRLERRVEVKVEPSRRTSPVLSHWPMELELLWEAAGLPCWCICEALVPKYERGTSDVCAGFSLSPRPLLHERSRKTFATRSDSAWAWTVLLFQACILLLTDWSRLGCMHRASAWQRTT